MPARVLEAVPAEELILFGKRVIDADVELIDVRTLRPLDVNTIVESVKKTNRLVIVDEDWGYCGMGSGIMYRLQKPCFDYLDAPVMRVNSVDAPAIYSPPVEKLQLPTVDRIYQSALNVLK